MPVASGFPVSSGDSATDLSLSGGQIGLVFSGGTAIATTVSSGGELFLSGTGSATIVLSGGTEIVSSGGSEVSGRVAASGTIGVVAGGTSLGATVSGGALVLSGGSGTGDKVVSGSETILSGGVETNGSVTTANGTQTIGSGGAAISETVQSGIQTVSRGGTSIGASIASGGAVILSGGIASGTTILSGGTDIVASGGMDNAATINSGGVQIVSGGTDIGAIVSGGGVQTVLAGGTAISGTIAGGGIEIISSGGTAIDDDLVGTGASVLVSSGGFVSFSTASVGAFDVYGVASGISQQGNIVSTTVESGGTDLADFVFGSQFVSSGGLSVSALVFGPSAREFISGGGTATSTTVISRGTVIAASGGLISSGLAVGSGGTAVLYGANGSAPINFVSSGGVVDIVTTTLPGSIISGFGKTTLIDLAAYHSNQVTVTSSGGTSFVSAGGQVLEVVGAKFYLQNDPGSGTYLEACFARGTHIATPSGEVAVEHLKAGDIVTTLAGPAPVRWIGYRNVRLSPAEFAILQSSAGSAPPSPESRIAQMPIRIARGAIAPEMPHRDLLVSPEHAIHIDGVLVPARHLVNGASITRVTTMASIQYFHVELDRHGLLISEGLASESWLDTGNRAAFENANETVVPHPLLAERTAEIAWATKAAAPLVTSGPVLGRIREKLIATAYANGLLTDDPDLRIAIGGVECRPLRTEGRRRIFEVPAGARDIVIRSRAACACDVLADSADVRRLGVSLATILLNSARGERWIGLADPMLREGFHACEGPSEAPFRWTDGNAALPPALLVGFEDGFTLTLDIAGKIAYPMDANAATCDGRERRSAQAE